MKTKPFPTHATVARQIESDVDQLTLLATADSLAGLYFSDRLPEGIALPEDEPGHPVLDEAVAQLTAYFAGQLTQFDLPLDPRGTSFQSQVWKALLEVPFGKTASYGEIAAMLENPKAVRAVGLANGSNPISIIVPCHRIIGASGKLTGYGGGLERKRRLLAHEAVGVLL